MLSMKEWLKKLGFNGNTNDEYANFRIDLERRLNDILSGENGKKIFVDYLQYRIDTETKDLHNLLILDAKTEIIKHKENQLMKLLGVQQFIDEIRGTADSERRKINEGE